MIAGTAALFWQMEKEVPMRYGALEAGGTKMVCGVMEEDGTVLAKVSIPTKLPDKTMKAVAEWFADKEISGLGVAAFGPICLDEKSPKYGYILETTKTEWKYYDLLTELRPLGVPIALDTDVNGACLGEAVYGCAKGISDVLYLTVGTGIGAGIVIGGRPVHGMLHPEAGHVRIRKRTDDSLKSVCAYHENCVEGLASGSAIFARYHVPASELSDRDDVWELEADYLAQAIAGYICTVSPKKVILGGGVMHQEKLFPLIRKKVAAYLNGYLVTAELTDMEQYICPSALKDNQGILGCLALIMQKVSEKVIHK